MEESYNRCTKQSKTNSALTIKSDDKIAGAAAAITAAQTSNVHAPSEVGNQHEKQPLDPSPSAKSLVVPEQHKYVPMANVVRIMRSVLPANAKISDDAKETVQVSVSKYINFITQKAKLRCQQQKRRIMTAEDIIWAIEELGFDDYVGPIAMFKDRYLESHENGRSSAQKQRTAKRCSGGEAEAVDFASLGMGDTGLLAMGTGPFTVSDSPPAMGDVGPLGMGDVGPLVMGSIGPLEMGTVGPLGMGNIGPVGLENTGLLGIANVGPLGMGEATPLGMDHLESFRFDNAGPLGMGNTGPLDSNGPLGSIGPVAHNLCLQQPFCDPLMMNPYNFKNNNSDSVGASSSVANNVLGADPYAQ